MIVLLILKIIGIILASLVGLVLLILAVVCFAPITYNVHGNKEESALGVSARVKWLLGLLSVSLDYSKKLDLVIKICGVKIGDKEKKSEKKTEEKKSSENTKTEETKKEKTKKDSQKKSEEEESKSQEPEKEETKKPEEKESKINKVLEKTKKIKLIATSEKTKKALSKLKVELFKILNHFKPRRIMGKVLFGMKEPDKTAFIYGIAGNIIGQIDNSLIMIPDMENQVLDFDVTIKGRLFIGYVLGCIIRLILDKNVLSTIKKLRRV